jgi:hypothetical protein
MHDETTRLLESRLAKLESHQRAWQGAALLACAAALAPWVLGAGQPGGQQNGQPSGPAPDLKVSSLGLVGPDGTEYATLALDKGAPTLMLRKDDRHVMLTLGDNNAGLAAGGKTGVVFVGVSPDAAYFNARGSDLKTGVFAGVDAKLNAAFRGYAADMQVAASLDVPPAGGATLTLTDPKSGPFQLPASASR